MAHKEFTDSRNNKTAKDAWTSGITFSPDSNNRKLLSALLSEADRLDRDLEEVLEAFHINTATSEELDKFGALVDLYRKSGEADDKYRTRIKAEIAQPRAETDYNDFVEFVATILETENTNFTLLTNYDSLPAVVTIRTQSKVFQNAALTTAEAVDILNGGIPAGHEVKIETFGTLLLKQDGDTDTAENGLTSDSISTGGTLSEDLT